MANDKKISQLTTTNAKDTLQFPVADALNTRKITWGSLKTDAVTEARSTTLLTNYYDTGWINNSDWTDLEINVNHALGVPLSQLFIKFLLSTDGTDNASFDILNSDSATVSMGATIFQTDNNNIQVQTGSAGMRYMAQTTGTATSITNQNWYYKVVVIRMF